MRVRIHIGPTLVARFAQRMRDVGYDVVAEGTEHVYVIVDARDFVDAITHVLDTLRAKYGSAFGLCARDFTSCGAE